MSSFSPSLSPELRISCGSGTQVSYLPNRASLIQHCGWNIKRYVPKSQSIIFSNWESPSCQWKEVTDRFTNAADYDSDDQTFDTSCLKFSVILSFAYVICLWPSNKVNMQWIKHMHNYLTKNFYCPKFVILSQEFHHMYCMVTEVCDIWKGSLRVS